MLEVAPPRQSQRSPRPVCDVNDSGEHRADLNNVVDVLPGIGISTASKVRTPSKFKPAT
jgi:hypothetical protein